MISIDLQAIPNQSFSVRLSNKLYNITIKETRGVMCMSVTRDNVLIISNTRITAGFQSLPYLYLEDGNFYISNQNDDLIYYDKFNVSQFLFYVDSSELLTIRNS